MKTIKIVNKIVDELWKNGLTIDGVDISDYEQAITKTIIEEKK